MRAEKLRLDPTCEVLDCGRRATMADHHVSTHAGGAPFDLHNLQNVCWSCHSQKTTLANCGFGRPAGKTPTGVKGCDTNGVLLDPRYKSGW